MRNTVDTLIKNSERQDVDAMSEFLKTLPEKAQEYIRGCVDMAKLLSGNITPPEKDKAS